MTVKEYNELVDGFADRVFRFVLKNIRDEEKAKDLVQDAFEKVWNKREEVNPEKSKAYLFTTAYRCVIDLVRKEKKQANWDEVKQEAFSMNDNYSDLSEVLQEALAQLPLIQRSVIMLRDYEGYEYNEISDITQLSLSQVKVYIFRARKSLKDYLVSVETVL